MIYYENLKASNAQFLAEMTKASNRVLASGHYVLGPEVEAFESEFSDFVGVKYCVGVANGLDALILSLVALDLPNNGEVILPANTYIATIIAVVRAGLVPVLIEPVLETYNIDTSKIEEKITGKTVAICLTHLYGKVADMAAIKGIVQKYKLYLVEDCAQSHGASLNGIKSGGFGDVGCFSFYPTKNLGGTGDGGAITTNDQKIYQRLRSLRNYGSSKKYVFQECGFNSRLDEIQASMLRVKLKYLDRISSHKNRLAEIYFSRLKNVVTLPCRQKGFYDVHHIFPIRHSKRDELCRLLEAEGVGTSIHYPVPPHRQEALSNYEFGELKITELIHNTILSLPISFGHSAEDIEKTCDAIIKITNNFGNA